jgi:tRNA A-37 threonylcarbamoyl transferase component Bud32
MVADRYRIESRLGRGGMADVYSAHDTVLDREVAIKLLREAPDSATGRARFVSEARILAGISDPGLVTVLDAGITGDHPYLVMEPLPGGTVADLVDAGSQPLDRVADIGAQVASALVPVHAAGVVHRDVKPGNLLFDAQGRVRLADFGIARLIGDTVRVTATGTMIGTASYLAPEQASGADVGTAADVYSLGLVLLELITGAPAFAGTPTEAALARLTHDPAVPVGLPAPLGRLINAMTLREPAARPTAAEVAVALAEASRTLAASRAAQAQIDTQALVMPASAPAATPAWWRRRSTRSGALAGAAAVIALGLVIGVPGEGAPGDARALRAPEATATEGVPQAEPSSVAATPDAEQAADLRPAKHHGAARAKHHKPKHHGAKPKHHGGKPKHHGGKTKHHKPPKHHGH